MATDSSHTAATDRALTARALVIGALGSAILTASSLFIALRLGALPWPIVFAALASVGALRLFGSHNLHEANVCHAAMSAGSMVAGGLAFTIPGLWMLGGADVSLVQVLAASLAGTILGLAACAMLQPYFIREQRLAYPIGVSAAETLKATSDTGGAEGRLLFGGMGFSAIYALLRDVLGILPQYLGYTAAIPGVTLGLYNSPMMLSMGFLIGVVPAFVWFGGTVVGSLAIGAGLPALGVCTVAESTAIRQCLGLGLMFGVGAGIVVKGLAPVVKRLASGEKAAVETDADEETRRLHADRRFVGIAAAVAAAIAATLLGLGLLPSVILVVGAWFCVYLSGWLTGTTGVNPMELFGVMVLLLLQVLFHQITTASLFLAAAVVAVACGIGGDVMNDLKAGDELRTDPRDQFTGMVVGGLVGAVVAAGMLAVLKTTYGVDQFGGNGMFVAAQASVVATMAGGIPNVPAFAVGVVLGAVGAIAGLPIMTLGLGVYLPFTTSSGVMVGALVRLIVERRAKDKTPEEQAKATAGGQTLASGFLGGESLVGVVMALVLMFGMLA